MATAVGMVTISKTATPASGAALLLVALVFASSRIVEALDLEQCGAPLGMESGAIRDADITASSAYDSGSVGPQHARLRIDKHGGAWCPRQMVSSDAKEWLEVDLRAMHVVTGSRSQGRFGNGQGQEYAEHYKIDYWRPGFTHWARWKNRIGKELLTGNTNTYTVVEQKLDPPILATKIRFLPYSEHVRTACMRVELVGCRWREGLVGYAMPQGVRRGAELDLSDRTYDGREDAGQLTDGLGQLVDGQKGQDNFRLDLTGHGKGYEWIGWRNDTLSIAGRYVEIVFEFDRVRNFSAAHLHTNNLFTKDVQVFSHAKAFFSIGGRVFSGEPVHFSYMPDLVLEHARNVTIKLHHRVGRFVRLQLYFAARWIMLSEVSFTSGIVRGNITDEEIEDLVPMPEAGKEGKEGKEYPLQRDEVQTTLSKINSNVAVTPPKEKNTESKGYIGPVIGILSIVIVILVGAIIFIVYRNQRAKASPVHSALPVSDLRNDMKLSMEECDKTALYHPEPCRLNMYTSTGRECMDMHGGTPDYIDVPDIMCQDYPMPHHPVPDSALPSFGMGPQTPVRPPPPIHNFLPKPPPVPPPPEQYYAAAEISAPAVSPPGSAGLAPKMSSMFMLPMCPDLEDSSGHEEDEVDILEFSRDGLRVLQDLGTNQFGPIHLCEVQRVQDSRGYLVSVNTLQREELRGDFVREARALARLKDTNVALLLGACLQTDPLCVVREYAEFGDLCQFLQDHVAETTTPRPPNASTLSYGCLIYMATQIASGMKYLESVNYVHKDLATRNCLIGPSYGVKVSDLGPGRALYCADYCQLTRSYPVPLRWMSWESVLLGKYTTKGDVWSFAVTLWEILTFAREQPFEEYTDEKVVENLTHFYQDDGKHMLLAVPINCPKEIFDLMCECWQRNESDRPNFREIHLFLQRKNLGYKPDMN